jgi:hypothetical protein
MHLKPMNPVNSIIINMILFLRKASFTKGLSFVLFNLLVFTACEKSLLHEEFGNDPKGNFNAFWSEFDRFYGAFEPKNINWDSLKIVYGSGINENSTDHELYKSICGLLASINDGHASIYSPEFGAFRSWSRRGKLYFNDVNSFDYQHIVQWTNLVQNKYLGSSLKYDVSLNFLFYYGSIQYAGYKIGYLYIPTFIRDNFPNDFINKAAEYLKNTDAVILDIRFNGGGSTDTFVKAMNLFTSEKKLYLKSKFRNGPDHSDFSILFDHYTNNNLNSGFFNKPMAILVNSFSSSSSEHFLLGMKTQIGVFSVGDTTCGAFSSVQERLMPNGWIFKFGAQVIYTPEGKLFTDQKGRYLEGIGIPPDYYVPDSYKAIEKRIDKPLDFALNELIKRLD